MKSIPQKEIMKIELDILCYIDDICQKNNIVYSLAYGTLLGAIRHKGFIPWDDDIDICMDRVNFEKFVNVCKNCKNDKYELLWLDTIKKYTLPLPKVIDKSTILTQTTQCEKMPLGVYVDIFIFDNIPNNSKARKGFIRNLELLQRFWGYSQNKYVWKDKTVKSYIRYLVYSVFHLINPRVFSRLLNKYSRRYNCNRNSKKIGSMVYSIKREGRWYNNHFFDKTSRVPFEGRYFLISDYYDEMLKMCYGNYMELPPIEKQVSHHDFLAYYK